jgi:ribonuclease P protein subunit POP4
MEGMDYVASKSIPDQPKSIFNNRVLASSNICLDNHSQTPSGLGIYEKRKAARADRHHKWKSLSTRRFRKSNALLQKSTLKYEKFGPIADLWREYAARLSETEQTVSKMDFHGAHVVVVSSADPSIVGVHGLVVKESFGELVLISEDDAVRHIPKNHTVINLETPKGHFEVNLGAMRCRPYLRATKKWKHRTPLPLPY